MATSGKCGYAFPGTWGHECGALGTTIGVFKSDMTKSGIFYSPRCDSCRTETGRDNHGVQHWEAPGQPHQVNDWK